MSFRPSNRRRTVPVALLSLVGLLGAGLVAPTTATAVALDPAPIDPASLDAAALDTAPLTASYDDVELQARSNLLVNDNGYHLPPGSSFNSITPDINDNGDVAFRVQIVPDRKDPGQSRPGLWLGGHGTGQIVHTGDVGGMIDNDATLNNDQDVAFTLSDGGFANNLYRYDASSQSAEAIGTAPVFPNSYSSPHLNDSGDIGFQANFSGGRAYAAFSGGAGVMYAADDGIDPNSPYTYFYTPSHNNAGQIAAKVATSDDLVSDLEIRLFEADGSSQRILANQAVDPGSPYSRFSNSLALNDNGTVAVIATRADDDQPVLVRSDGTTTTEIAEVDPDGTIRAFHLFPPAINNAGQVAFRADDATGQAIYVADGGSLQRVIGEGDVVEADLGTAQLGQHDDSPVFGGAPSINDGGDIVFTAGLHPQGDNQTEWGSGVMVAYAGDSAEPEGAVEGVVTDANDGDPVEGATVTATTDDGTVAGETTTDSEGGYELALEAGDYTASASAPGYESAHAGVTVEPGQTSTVDLPLTTAVMEVAPGSVQFTGEEGAVHSADLTITNSGSAELSWQIDGDAAWLTTDPSAGGVAEDASSTVELTADSSGLETGTHEATLVISGNAAKQPTVEVPVRLDVAPAGDSYDVAVNVGGEAYLDAAGTTWQADRRHTDGEWGYVGRHHRTSSTGQGITGAEDAVVYQDRRDGVFSYRFDDVPAGSYLVDLRFAEFQADPDVGQRQFDVAVGGEEVLSDHDVAAEVGGLAADRQTIVVEHDGGNLVIDFQDQRSSRFPIVNALRVTAR